MKKLFLILCLALFSCSAEEVSQEEEIPEEVEFATVVIYETCPERTGSTSHSVDKPTWEKLYAKMNDIPWGSSCLLFEFTNLEKEEVRGYYSAMFWPGSWDEE